MTEEKKESLVWGIAALLLWLVFFGVGLFPDFTFEYLRAEGNVVTQNAMTNSVHLLYVMQVVYFFFFLVRAARGAGLESPVSQVLAVQLALVAMLAFIPGARVEDIPAYMRVPHQFSRWLLLGVCSLKLAGWLYLLSLVFRYYILSGGEVFRQMVPVFLSGTPGEDGHDDSDHTS